MEKNLTNTGKNRHKKAGSQSHNTLLSTCLPNMTTLAFTTIFDENFHYSKYGKEENWTNTGKNKHQKAGSHLTIQFNIINLHTKYDNTSLHSFIEIFDKNFIIQSMERKKIGQIQGRLSRRRLVHNPTIQYIIINLHTKNFTTLPCTVSQKSLTKNFIIQSMERKKIGQMLGRISMRRLVRNPTIQNIIIILHTKYDYCSLHGLTEIFDEKFHYLKYEKK